jgi:hypothetical protein
MQYPTTEQWTKIFEAFSDKAEAERINREVYHKLAKVALESKPFTDVLYGLIQANMSSLTLGGINRVPPAMTMLTGFFLGCEWMKKQTSDPQDDQAIIDSYLKDLERKEKEQQ